MTGFLATRATDPEQLDQGVPEAEALRSLRDLQFVNRRLGNAGRLLPPCGPTCRRAAACSTRRVGLRGRAPSTSSIACPGRSRRWRST
ncbi:MAG: hypothetical protein U0599_03960 [Vicinamibacteria bacterium]